MICETVFCAGKSVEQITRILQLAQIDDETLLLTRLDPEKVCALPGELAECLDYDEISATAFLGEPGPVEGRPSVAVVTAGTSDVGVAREASRTLYKGP